MKLKLAGSANMPLALYVASISPATNTWYVENVIVGCLGVDPTNIKPSTHYIQWGDPTVKYAGGVKGMEVGFSKLSAWPAERSGRTFHNARVAIQRKFTELIQTHVREGDTMSLFICSQTDMPVPGVEGFHPDPTTQHELDAIWVPGKAKPDPVLDIPLEHFLLAPILHEVQRLREIAATGQSLDPHIVTADTFFKKLGTV